MNEREKLSCLRLIRSENIGPATYHRLLRHAGSAEAAIHLLPDLSRRGGGRILQPASEQDALREWEALDRFGGRLIALDEPGYPPHLREIDAAPPLISAIGSGKVLAREQTVGIVGARNSSMSGEKIASEIAGSLADAGYVIVSGLARGIDGAAHRASLKGGTVAVLAGGVDILYPPEHGPLLRSIVDQGGAVISEMPLGWKPRARDFPRRNRLISGLSLGVVLIEAARASGSLHTARFALEQNREVMAVPGSPLDPRSEGGNLLIREGAALVANASDVIETLHRGNRQLAFPRLDLREDEPVEAPLSLLDDSERGVVLSALGPVPVDPDELAVHVGLPVRKINVVLLELELSGRLERHGGGTVSLVDAR
ncbi:DNA-protecting protein DprA [Stappia sp. F7233]|uniref:DNA-protecting protein DprA n=1 Tax=Stappia albiluteola TaxID=2758565 RepID=A0A839AEK7_9HYPH|nr:DNA-processing protein DprA [Stappia albiluteola]MBA5778011.1 DNA-protecting protein DprA [Stappia albiluteola]